MAFLFGDLTPAPFTTNFLEELRDIIDFAAAIAETDQTIVNADAMRAALRHRADEDAARLEALVRSVLAAADAADKGGDDSLAGGLAADIAKVVAARHEATSAALTTRLAAAIAAVDAATVSARSNYFALLEEFLLEQSPPSAAETLRIELVATPKKDDRHYTGQTVGRSELGLDWSIEMSVPAETWKAPLRVDAIVDDLSILAPQLTGLIKKEVKPKKQKLDRHCVTKVVRDDANLHIELRAEIGGDEGYDISAGLDEDGLVVVKVGAPDDVTVGPFAVAAEDRTALLALATKLHAMTKTLSRKRLVAATFDGLPFDGTNDEAQPRLVELVTRLVAKLAPHLDQIAARSRSDDELVLRVTVDDGRREEIFMPKARLRENLSTLDDAHRKLFRGFAAALDSKPPASAKPASAATRTNAASAEPPDAPPSVRSEVPPLVRRKSGNMQAVVVPAAAPVPVAPAPDWEPTLPKRAPAPAPAAAAPTPAPAPAPASTPEPAPASSRSPDTASAELVATLKHIRGIAENGHLDEAFRQYAALFASAAFAKCPADKQRQALKLLIFGKTPASPSDEMRAAHRAAVAPLQALVVVHRDPADYEMLGMAYVASDQPDKGSEMFKKALELERARNPASDLCGNLMRRVSQL